MGSNSSLPELLHNLDATTYFFVTSGLFIGLVALVFFILGLWFGGLLWRGYKRRYRTAEATIESLKNEAAQLKRRIAGQSPRRQGSASTLGLPEPEFAPSEEEAFEEQPLEKESFPLPPGQPFTLWTLPNEDESPPAPLPASRAFTVWTEPPVPKAVRIVEVLSNTPADLPAPAVTGFTAPLLFPTQPESRPQLVDFPPSQAFSLWTEEGWEPVPVPAPPTPKYSAPSTAFTLWTAEDFRPAHVRLSWPPSAAFTLWTHPDFVPVSHSPAPAALPMPPISRDAFIAATATAVRSVASHPRPAERRVIVTFPDERPSSPRSHAFTLWTQPSGEPMPSGSGISQRSALASLIRNRVDVSPLPPLPPLDMEPLPFVPVPKKDAQGA